MREKDFVEYEEYQIAIDRIEVQRINIGFAGVNEYAESILRKFNDEFKMIQIEAVEKLRKLQEEI